LEVEGTANKQFQKAVRENLKDQLGGLPTPKNDYEIVVPEDEDDVEMDDGSRKGSKLEDKEELDRRAAEEAATRRMEEFKKLCKAVQRNLPRPMDVNELILRPPGMDLNDLQKVKLI
jgi:pre-mRNA-splicing factor CDC5/CEF1